MEKLTAQNALYRFLGTFLDREGERFREKARVVPIATAGSRRLGENPIKWPAK
jgi:hypothetical protein